MLLWFILNKNDPEARAIEEHLVEDGFCPIEKDGDFVGFVREIAWLNGLRIVKIDVRDPDISSDLAKARGNGSFLSFRPCRVRRRLTARVMAGQ